MSLDRFWSKVEKTDGCWNWTAAKHQGYGAFGVGANAVRRAHRVAYELLVGPIPEGLELDHLCRNRACVNPEHLEPVSHAANMARGTQAAVTHCKRGHEFTEANTYRRSKGNGVRRCRACHREAERGRYKGLSA